MSLIIVKATNILFERIWISQVGAYPSYLHLSGGPSTGETFTLASCFQVRRGVDTGWNLWLFPREQYSSHTAHGFCCVGCVGNLAQGQVTFYTILFWRLLNAFQYPQDRLCNTSSNIRTPFREQVPLNFRILSTPKYSPCTIWLIKHSTIPIRWTTYFPDHSLEISLPGAKPYFTRVSFEIWINHKTNVSTC